ncbi:hypothetical protein TTHERM_00263170 (macronuclear) [Tetrahymena thermophila SB210]|uniref:Uncharacterized protein n=1 Tax=Tetrahymena thermophila (strain SB210) TaxID=312017 RepID=Q22U66_TETTS|nr:hypothetical protein TTHERM_00263170 [Tetrahymena thermophila SB210]EAR88821.1 hypothetical protein TTHERM_00263170 [Tetrahymena thermophila SB210]|eukprot:XP_001009066.1 hypothetical protein TTHERM_00263170 [Tetrahymena thermophila SB210]
MINQNKKSSDYCALIYAKYLFNQNKVFFVYFKSKQRFYQFNLFSNMNNSICDEDQNIFYDSNYLRDEQVKYPQSYFQYQEPPYLYSEQSLNNTEQQLQTPQYTLKQDTLSIQNNQTGSNFYVNLIQRQHSSFSLKNNNYSNINNNNSSICNNIKFNVIDNNFIENQQSNLKNFQMEIYEEFCSPNSKIFGLRDQGEDYLQMNNANQGGIALSSGIQQTILQNFGSNQKDINQDLLFENTQEQYIEITQIQGIKQNQTAIGKIDNKLEIKGDLIDSLQKSNEIKIKRMEKKKQKQLAFQQKISSYPKRVLRSQTGQNTPVKMQDSTQKTIPNKNEENQNQKNRYIQESNQSPITQNHEIETHLQIKEILNEEISQQNSYPNDHQNFLYCNQTQLEQDIPQNLVTVNRLGIHPNQNNYYYTQNSQQQKSNLNYQNSSIFMQNQLKMGENSLSNQNQFIQPIQNNSDINFHQNLLHSQIMSQNEDEIHQDRNQQEYFEIEDNKEYSQIFTSNQREYTEDNQTSNLSKIPDFKGLLTNINTIQKKNVVKNLMTSFKRFVVSLFENEQQTSKKTKKDYLFKKSSIKIYFDQNQQQNPEVLSQIRNQILSFYYNYQNQDQQQDEQNFLKKYKRYLDNKLFNHYTLSLLLKHKQYALIFKYYLENFVSNWLINSKVNDRISHQLMVEFLLKSYSQPQLVQNLHHNQYQKEELVL